MWPDGFIGDDPTSRHNALWLGIFLIIVLLLSSCTTPQPSGPALWRIPGSLFPPPAHRPHAPNEPAKQDPIGQVP